ncbi:DNA polymerase I [Bacteroides sp. ET336]|uniref:DNA polymerase I n=1 Tax=Bacteroides sp. ET336 TaxID=2972459 RepID=UPI0021AD1504|nr:DNA polymerase I [Bacteroides sp. ET336]MCR8894353.1 DNA polymerase I [Bacteroides sp. ET336]MDN0058849.1 DNA polymerase I [Bacteroides caecigallinarum]
MDKLFLLDAYALIYRAYYALIKSPRINSKGFNTSAILGFVNTLEDVLKKESPTHIGVAFDPSGPTFRHEAYKEYKAQREETPEAIRLSVPIIKDIIRAYKIPILEVPGYEADDVIGTLATEAGKRGITTYMMTPDKDYGQLVSENVFMYRPKYGDKEFDIMGIEEVKAKFNIESTSQVIDMLGLMGDSSDNIPGCPGVGEKTAQKLISEFGSIENLLEHTDQLKGAIKTKVESNVEKIKFSKFLATIKTDVPIELDMDSLKRETPDEEKLRSIFEELEFRTLLERVFKSDKKPAAKPAPEKQALQGNLFGFFADDNTEEQKNSSLKRLEDTDYDYQLIDTEDKINDFLRIILTKEIISLDTETTGTDAMSAELVGMSFSYKENQAFYVPVPQDREEAQKIVDKFKPVFENEKSIKVGQNIKYDMIVLGNYGVSIKGQMFDTMIAHYVLQPELHHGMDYLAEVYLKYDTIKIEELIGAKGKNQRNMRDLSPTDIYKYACEDADVTLKLKNILEKELETNGVKELFEEIEMPLVPVLAYIERNGVRIDTEALKETSRHFTIRMREIEEEIYKLAGMEFNVSSPKQVGEVLFDRLKIVEKAKKTKTGQYVTSEEVLESLKGKHQIVEKILDYRGLKKLLSTYVDALPELINPKTGRIHTSFNQTVTATGRLSSSNPNLQNIPVRDDDGKEIRKAFIPDDGCEFFSADYSQIELRIMAHLSEDDNMIEAFREEQDIHAATAAKIYKINIDEVTREQRSKAKTANFGIIYGISVFGLAERLNVDRKEAKELIDGYFENYPKVKAYMDESIRSARDKGYIETIFKRKRYLPDINSRNAVVRGYAERNAINAPIQGSAADIIKVAMIRIYKRFMDEGIKSKMILQVHDELNFSVLREEKEKVQQIVISEMEAAYKMKVPLLADCGWGQNWLEAH